MKDGVQIRGDRAIDRIPHHRYESGLREVTTHGFCVVSGNDANSIALRRWQREESLTIARIGLATAEDPALWSRKCRRQIRPSESGASRLWDVVEDEQPALMMCGYLRQN
jgi:hypothetical protein